ncbi:MAG: Fe-S cluster assembly protein HesB [Candidatus Levybacteria bacterium]|nr:Fe-S cluster assembly protein HesB [Candidatus Levybacteria bacterium]
MLQQTQVVRVMPKYDAWLQAFPTVKDLANAKTAEVLRLWSGLGYNRRALYLQKCAKILCHPEFISGSPWDSIASLQNDTKGMMDALKKLPGIGEYTAAAVACFAFDQQVAVVDTNIRKVILIEFKITNYELRIGDKQIQIVADALLPRGRAYEWNQALMDYASAMLKKEKIPVAKQSKFKGSDRYYRGQIVKMLLDKKEITVTELISVFKKNEAFVSKIIQGLVKDGMVKKEGNYIFFASH